jgi:hypothetical protein
VTSGYQPPNPPSESYSAETVEIERAVLRAICAFAGEPERRQLLLKKLNDYSWRDPDHAVVYRALRALPDTGDASTWRELLPGAATRMGFPDLNWEYYFGGEDVEADEAERAIGQLFKTGKDG